MEKCINIKNQEKVRGLIEKAEGNARTRCLDLDLIDKSVSSAETILKELGIAQKHWIGTSIILHPGKVNNSYGWYGATGTYATIIRKSSGWFISEVHRRTVYSVAYGKSKSELLILSDNALMNSQRKFNLDTD